MATETKETQDIGALVVAIKKKEQDALTKIRQQLGLSLQENIKYLRDLENLFSTTIPKIDTYGKAIVAECLYPFAVPIQQGGVEWKTANTCVNSKFAAMKENKTLQKQTLYDKDWLQTLLQAYGITSNEQNAQLLTHLASIGEASDDGLSSIQFRA